MRAHTSGFKEQIKELGREIDSKITYGSNVIYAEDLFSVVPVLNADILKSVMKQLDFESSIQVPVNTVLKYEFGLKVNGGYEYLNYGNYVVYSCEYNEDTHTYEHTCYDSMLFSMKEYTTLQNGVFPMTIREYITNLCLDCGLVFKNANDNFANYNKIIDNDLYANLGYTYRDIFDELAQVTASAICIDLNDQVEIRYINETNDVIDGEYLKNINVKFGEKYGPVNSVVLSRSGESDNIYLRDEDSISTNGLCELKIIDNQIMNFNNRSEYLNDILEKVKDLEYFINDYSSTGVLYYELLDRYSVKIGDNTYSCLMLNDEPKITQGIVEDIFAELPKDSVTDYTKADKTDQRINKAYIIVDKQNQEINSLVQKIDKNSEQITTTTQKVNGFEISVKEVQTSIDTVAGEVSTLSGKITDMTYNFGTKGLAIGTSQDSNNSLLDNTGIKVYNYDELNAIFNNKGSGIDKLIVTGTAQIGYLRFVKSTKNGKPVTKIFNLNQVIEDLHDLEV